MKRFIVGITGATGSIYGMRLIEELLKDDYFVFLTITTAGMEVIEEELLISLTKKTPEEISNELVKYFQIKSGLSRELLLERFNYLSIDRISASIASGSFLTEGMAVVPCSMATLAGIASGRSKNLLERAADVMLKEGRALLLAPRETPLNSIHLENMLKLSRLGVMIVPPMPGFYHNPKTIEELVDFVVGKILDRLKIPHQLFIRWK